MHIGYKNNHTEWAGIDMKDHPVFKYLVSPLLWHALMRLNYILNQYTYKEKKDAAGNVIKEVVTLKNMCFGRRLIPEIKIIWRKFKAINEDNQVLAWHAFVRSYIVTMKEELKTDYQKKIP